MKTNVRAVRQLIATSILMISLLPAWSQDKSRLYLEGDVGGTLTSDTDLKAFFGPVAPNSRIKFDPGIRVGFRAGYGLTDWFAAEAETGIMANNIDAMTGATELEATVANVPLLLNARFHCPRMNRLTPYFGGGLGVSTAIFSADDVVVGGTRMHGSAADVVFAYQGFAGLRCNLNERMGLSLEYRYFATTEPDWKADVSFGPVSDRLRIGRIETHALTIAFDWRF